MMYLRKSSQPLARAMCDLPPSMWELRGSLAKESISSEAFLSSISRPIMVSLLVRWMTPRRDLMAATGRATWSLLVVGAMSSSRGEEEEDDDGCSGCCVVGSCGDPVRCLRRS